MISAKKDNRRVKFSDLNMFTRQLYTLQKAGIPILMSLNSIREQSGNLVLKDVVTQLAKTIEAGSGLSDAMAQFPMIFNSVYVSMVRSGEMAGKLPEILCRLADLGEHDEKIRLHIQSAMRYPIIVVSVLMLGFFSLILLVVPKFQNLFARFDTALPLPTQMLLLIYSIIVHYWWVVLVLGGLLIFAAHHYVRTPQGKFAWNRVQLKIPLFGPLILKLILSRFCRITSTLLQSGVPILTILDLVRDTTDNAVVARSLERIKKSVSEGKGMLEPMKVSGLFPPIVTQMVSVGEETGKLDELLVHVADYYDSQVEYTISNLVSLIEPVLILFLGGTVLFLALGIFMPMWGLMKLFK